MVVQEERKAGSTTGWVGAACECLLVVDGGVVVVVVGVDYVIVVVSGARRAARPGCRTPPSLLCVDLPACPPDRPTDAGWFDGWLAGWWCSLAGGRQPGAAAARGRAALPAVGEHDPRLRHVFQPHIRAAALQGWHVRAGRVAACLCPGRRNATRYEEEEEEARQAMRATACLIN